MKIELHEHQKLAVDEMHNGCVLWGGVGTGKTITALAYAKLKEPGRNIVVVTTAKKRDTLDWEREAAMLQIPVEKIEVTSWNKINSFVGRTDEFFIFDEQRLVGTGAWVKSFYKIAKKNHWVLLSATPGDTWSDYAPMFIANGWYKNISEFRREHAIYSRYAKFPKIERWVGEGRLKKYREALLVEMPMQRHTTRHMHYIECDYDKETLDTIRKRRWNVYEDKPLKNASELYSVLRKVVSTDPSRASELLTLIANHPRLIVFYNFNYELEMMRELLGKISEDYSLKGIGKKPSTQHWDRTKSGLTIPSSIGISTKESLDLPWDLTPEEKASGQKVTTRHISREDTTELWIPTEQSKSRTASSRSDRQHGTTQQPEPSRPSPKDSPSLKMSPTPEFPQPGSRQTAKTRSRPVDGQLERRAKPARKLMQLTATSTALTTSTSSLTYPTTPAELWKTDYSSNSSILMSLGKFPQGSHVPLRNMEDSGSTRISPELESGTTFGWSKNPDGSSPSFGWSEWNGHKHQPIPDTDRWVYLVQYASGSEGWNCVDTDAMAFWSLTYSWKQFNQAQGRIDRLNTQFTDLHYHILMTKSVAEMPVIKALDAKHDFQPTKM